MSGEEDESSVTEFRVRLEIHQVYSVRLPDSTELPSPYFTCELCSGLPDLLAAQAPGNSVTYFPSQLVGGAPSTVQRTACKTQTSTASFNSMMVYAVGIESVEQLKFVRLLIRCRNYAGVFGSVVSEGPVLGQACVSLSRAYSEPRHYWTDQWLPLTEESFPGRINGYVKFSLGVFSPSDDVPSDSSRSGRSDGLAPGSTVIGTGGTRGPGGGQGGSSGLSIFQRANDNSLDSRALISPESAFAIFNLSVSVFRAEDLPYFTDGTLFNNATSAANACVYVGFGSSVVKLPVVLANPSPSWNSVISIPFHHSPGDDHLTIEVVNVPRGGNSSASASGLTTAAIVSGSGSAVDARSGGGSGLNATEGISAAGGSSGVSGGLLKIINSPNLLGRVSVPFSAIYEDSLPECWFSFYSDSHGGGTETIGLHCRRTNQNSGAGTGAGAGTGGGLGSDVSGISGGTTAALTGTGGSSAASEYAGRVQIASSVVRSDKHHIRVSPIEDGGTAVPGAGPTIGQGFGDKGNGAAPLSISEPLSAPFTILVDIYEAVFTFPVCEAWVEAQVGPHSFTSGSGQPVELGSGGSPGGPSGAGSGSGVSHEGLSSSSRKKGKVFSRRFTFMHDHIVGGKQLMVGSVQAIRLNLPIYLEAAWDLVLYFVVKRSPQGQAERTFFTRLPLSQFVCSSTHTGSTVGSRGGPVAVTNHPRWFPLKNNLANDDEDEDDAGDDGNVTSGYGDPSQGADGSGEGSEMNLSLSLMSVSVLSDEALRQSGPGLGSSSLGSSGLGSSASSTGLVSRAAHKYSCEPHILIASIYGACNLPIADAASLSDPVVSVSMLDAQHTTSVRAVTLNPSWNERLVLKVDLPSNKALHPSAVINVLDVDDANEDGPPAGDNGNQGSGGDDEGQYDFDMLCQANVSVPVIDIDSEEYLNRDGGLDPENRGRQSVFYDSGSVIDGASTSRSSFAGQNPPETLFLPRPVWIVLTDVRSSVLFQSQGGAGGISSDAGPKGSLGNSSLLKLRRKDLGGSAGDGQARSLGSENDSRSQSLSRYAEPVESRCMLLASLALFRLESVLRAEATRVIATSRRLGIPIQLRPCVVSLLVIGVRLFRSLKYGNSGRIVPKVVVSIAGSENIDAAAVANRPPSPTGDGRRDSIDRRRSSILDMSEAITGRSINFSTSKPYGDFSTNAVNFLQPVALDIAVPSDATIQKFLELRLEIPKHKRGAGSDPSDSLTLGYGYANLNCQYPWLQADDRAMLRANFTGIPNSQTSSTARNSSGSGIGSTWNEKNGKLGTTSANLRMNGALSLTDISGLADENVNRGNLDARRNSMMSRRKSISPSGSSSGSHHNSARQKFLESAIHNCLHDSRMANLPSLSGYQKSGSGNSSASSLSLMVQEATMRANSSGGRSGGGSVSVGSSSGQVVTPVWHAFGGGSTRLLAAVSGRTASVLDKKRKAEAESEGLGSKAEQKFLKEFSWDLNRGRGGAAAGSGSGQSAAGGALGSSPSGYLPLGNRLEIQNALEQESGFLMAAAGSQIASVPLMIGTSWGSFAQVGCVKVAYRVQEKQILGGGGSAAAAGAAAAMVAKNSRPKALDPNLSDSDWMAQVRQKYVFQTEGLGNLVCRVYVLQIEGLIGGGAGSNSSAETSGDQFGQDMVDSSSPIGGISGFMSKAISSVYNTTAAGMGQLGAAVAPAQQLLGSSSSGDDEVGQMHMRMRTADISEFEERPGCFFVGEARQLTGSLVPVNESTQLQCSLPTSSVLFLDLCQGKPPHAASSSGVGGVIGEKSRQAISGLVESAGQAASAASNAFSSMFASNEVEGEGDAEGGQGGSPTEAAASVRDLLAQKVVATAAIDLEDRWLNSYYQSLLDPKSGPGGSGGASSLGGSAGSGAYSAGSGIYSSSGCELPVEMITLRNPDTFLPKAKAKVAIEVMNVSMSTARPLIKLPSVFPEVYQIRIALFKAKNVPFLSPEDDSVHLKVTVSGTALPVDVFKSSQIGNASGLRNASRQLVQQMREQTQASDTHYGSLNGSGIFNWRFVFSVVYPSADCLFKFQVGHDPVGSLGGLLLSGTTIGECLVDLSSDLETARASKAPVDLPRSTLTLKNAKNKPKGQLEMSIRIVSMEEAIAHPVGLGRDEPNMDPFLDPNDPVLVEHRNALANTVIGRKIASTLAGFYSGFQCVAILTVIGLLIGGAVGFYLFLKYLKLV